VYILVASAFIAETLNICRLYHNFWEKSSLFCGKFQQNFIMIVKKGFYRNVQYYIVVGGSSYEKTRFVYVRGGGYGSGVDTGGDDSSQSRFRGVYTDFYIR
jgi:hypothetical protein